MLKIIVAHYTIFLWGLLKPLGAWGVLAIAALDGAFIGMPVDAAVATYVYQDPAHLLWYALMASLGSTLGSAVVYVVGCRGGEELLRKRIPAERFKRIHSAFQQHPFWSLMLPAMLPPPTPFKLFSLAAEASEMGIIRYLLAIFSGRVLRFVVLSVLTIKFGPQALHLTANVFSKHIHLVLFLVAASAVVWLLRWKQARVKRTALLQ